MSTKIYKTFLDKNGCEIRKLAVSYSQLDTFLTCPRRWMYRYLRGYGKSDDTESTQLGTQVHASIEEYCKRLSEDVYKRQGNHIDVLCESEAYSAELGTYTTDVYIKNERSE